MSLKNINSEEYLQKASELAEKVKIDNTHIIFSLPEGKIGDTYEVSLESIKTPEQLVSWIQHVSAKEWIDRAMLRRFIKLASGHLGITL